MSAAVEGLRRRRGVADDDDNDEPRATTANTAADAHADAATTTTTTTTTTRPPPESTSYLPLLFPLLLFVLTAISALVVSKGAPTPYMDEIFHVPQTRRLCERGFPAGLRGDSWDPKITTFPGLYVLGAAYASLQAGVLRSTQVFGGGGGATQPSSSFSALRAALCGEAGALRGLNGLLLALCFFPAFAVRMGVLSSRRKRQGEKEEEEEEDADTAAARRKDALGTALAAAVLLPTHFFFGFLYYTDVGALLFLLLAAQALQSWAELVVIGGGDGAVVAAAIAATASGAAAIAMRQTNAVWYAFLVGAALLRVAYGRMRGDAVRSGARLATAPFRAAAALARHTSSSFLAQLLLLLTPPFAFVAFVLLFNGGNVALGDHDAHDAASTRHWAHPFYAAAFCALGGGGSFFVRPEALGRLKGRFTIRRQRSKRRGATQQHQRLSLHAPMVALALAVVAASVAAAHYGTLAHPYLLADNRHYTFYAWRRTLGRHWAAKYALAPVTAAAWLLLGSELAAGVGGRGGGEEGDDGELEEEGLLWVLGFACACVLTLVPAGLIEPRYYTVPAVLAVLHAPGRLRRGGGGVGGGVGGARAAATTTTTTIDWSALVACSLFALVNAATLYAFAFRPFTWPDGSTARFMW